MSPEQINVAIAKACGWRAWTFGDPLIERQRFADTKFNGYVRRIERIYGTRGATLDIDESPIYDINLFGEGREYEPLSGWLSPKGRWKPNPPNYHSDLNAMHEAEKVLFEDDEGNEIQGRYLAALRNVMGGAACFPWQLPFAAAAQRAEAFLRTLNLWAP